jgi:hypothetical protein
VNPECECDCEQCSACSQIEASGYDERDAADDIQQQELDEASRG